MAAVEQGERQGGDAARRANWTVEANFQVKWRSRSFLHCRGWNCPLSQFILTAEIILKLPEDRGRLELKSNANEYEVITLRRHQ